MVARRKQPPTTNTFVVSITCILQSSANISILDSQTVGLLKLELLNMPRILSPEKPGCSPSEFKDFDGKHEIYRFVANILEKICE
jgi:hypothetical protein